MRLGLKRHTLDFDILDTGNPKTLVFLDLSSYYTEPDSPILQVTLPGHTKYNVVNIAARKINTFNSNTLGKTDSYNIRDIVALPDGVWTLTFRVCPYDEVYVQKYHLRTTILEQNLEKIFEHFKLLDCDVERDAQMRNDIVDILLAIESGKANAKKGNAKKASQLYQKADSLVTKILDNLSETCC